MANTEKTCGHTNNPKEWEGSGCYMCYITLEIERTTKYTEKQFNLEIESSHSIREDGRDLATELVQAKDRDDSSSI